MDGAARSSSDGAADGLSVQGERSRATPSMTTAQPAATARAASAAVHKVPTARPVNRQPGQRGGSAQQQNCVADTLNQVTLSLQPQPGAAEMSAGCTQKKQSRKQQDITTARQCTDITTAIQYTASTASTAPPRAHSSRAHSSSGFRLEEGSMSRSLASSMSSTVSRIPVRSAAAAGTLSLVAEHQADCVECVDRSRLCARTNRPDNAAYPCHKSPGENTTNQSTQHSLQPTRVH